MGSEVTQISPTVFRHGTDLIVIRHNTGQGPLPAHDRLIYVVDDDWRSGLRDPSLPVTYRLKLALTEARSAPMLEKRAELICVSTPALRHRLEALWPQKPVRELGPAWPEGRAPLAEAAPKRVALLQGMSHRRDARIMWQALPPILAAFPDTRLTVSANLSPPRALRRHAAVECVPAHSWPVYRQWMKGRRFDLLLCPARNGPFNAARSDNKLLEADQYGAALLCADSWPAGQAAQTSGRARCVAHDANSWQDAIAVLLGTPGLAQSMAQTNRAALVARRPLETQRLIWRDILARARPDRTGSH